MTKKTTDTLLNLCFTALVLSFSHTSLSTETESDHDSNDPFYIPDSEFVTEEDDDFYVDEYSENRAFFTLEALLGGSTLERITFKNGETSNIRAGSGVYLSVGFAHLIFNKNMDIGIKAGYIFDTVTAKSEDGDKAIMSFTRKAIDVFSHTWIGRHALGGGISYHLDPVFKSDNTHHSAQYNNAIGAYASYLYHFTGTGTGLGLKYSSINYKNKNTGRVVNGNGWGITFNQFF